MLLHDIVEPVTGIEATFLRDLDKAARLFLGKRFKGVFPAGANLSPNNLKDGESLILNLDRMDEPGSHWIALHYAKRGLLVYDSFGRKTSTLEGTGGKKSAPITPLLRDALIIDADGDAEQRIDEDNCGARSIAWLMLVRGWGPDMALLL